jgi:hypothetical protein
MAIESDAPLGSGKELSPSHRSAAPDRPIGADEVLPASLRMMQIDVGALLGRMAEFRPGWWQRDTPTIHIHAEGPFHRAIGSEAGPGRSSKRSSR